MDTFLAIIAALSLATIPLVLGWRFTSGEARLARVMGLAPEKRGFDPETYARQTGTGLTFNQIAVGVLAWAGGGLLAGISIGLLPAILFSLGGGLLYWGGLSDRRQEYRLRQAKDILQALNIMETLVNQGKGLEESLRICAESSGGARGNEVLRDLVRQMRATQVDQVTSAIRNWSLSWQNPGVDMFATALLAHYEGHVEIGPLVATLRKTLLGVVEVLSRARAAAKGVEWQAKFLALFPPLVMVAFALIEPELARIWSENPLYLVPVLAGSAASFLLSMRMVRNGLSIEASVGLQAGQQGEIRVDKLGRLL